MANAALYAMGEDQGLKGAKITCTFTDKDGFLWIASDKGLYRYDGENLFCYLPGPLVHQIYSMIQDSSGQLWLTFENAGLKIIDRKAMLLKTVVNIGNDNIIRMVQDQQQMIWLTNGSKGVDIIDLKKRSVRLVPYVKKDVRNTDLGIACDPDNKIWVTTIGGGINIYDIKNNMVSTVGKAQGLSTDTLSSIVCDSEGRIWVSSFSDGTMDVIDLNQRKISRLNETKSEGTGIWALLKYNNGQVAVGTTNKGLQIVDIDQQKIKNIHTTSGTASDLGDYVENLNMDYRGQTWIATGNGLNILRTEIANIENIDQAPTKSIFEDAMGLIWQGSLSSGVNIINPKNKTIKHLGAADGLSNDTIQNITGGNGKIVISSNSGVDIIDSAKKTILHLGKKQGLIDKHVDLTSFVGDSLLCIGSKNGLVLYNFNTGAVLPTGRLLNPYDSYIDDIRPDKNQRFWVSTHYGGIYRVDLLNHETWKIGNPEMTREEVTRILQTDSAGNLWIGTDMGVYVADIKNDKLISFPAVEGLADEPVVSLSQYHGQIYAGTRKDVFVVSQPVKVKTEATWQINRMPSGPGLLRTDVGYHSTDLITRNGQYWWGDKEIAIVDLSKKHFTTAKTYITGINIRDQSQSFTGSPLGQQPAKSIATKLKWDSTAGPYNMPVNLVLPYDQNYIRFHFAALNLLKQDSSAYTYLLDGVDKNWSAKTNVTFSGNYFNLSPGDYTFKVIAIGADGQFNKPAIIAFTITPPWWKTWLAYSICFLLLAGSIRLYIYYRSLKHVKEKQILEREVLLRTEEVMQQKEEIESQRDSLEKTVVELKDTQQQLIQSEKLASLGELTAGIAHEIQNPLNFVNNFADLNVEMLGEIELEIDKGDLDEVKVLIAEVKQNSAKITFHGKRADGIVKGMLEHSRASSGLKEQVDLNKLADEYLRLAYHGFRAKDKIFNTGLITDFDQSLSLVKAIPQDLGRVLLNLFNNAFYAVQQKMKQEDESYKPVVAVSTTMAKNNVVIEVKDNGSGIPDGIKEKIMQPFFTTKPAGEGTGLGLSLSYDIIKVHGGQLTVSTAEKGFTIFRVSIPVS